jgi:hypothetical protein
LKEVLVSPKQSIMASENTFHSTSSICKLDEPILQLKKEIRATMHSPEQFIPERILDIPEGEEVFGLLAHFIASASINSYSA